jgi:hypothetical protein
VKDQPSVAFEAEIARALLELLGPQISLVNEPFLASDGAFDAAGIGWVS